MRIPTLRRLLPSPALARFAASWGAWVTGESAALVVLSVVAYNEAGLGAVGVAGALRVLPAIVAAPWGAVLTDRFPRVRVLVSLHVLNALQLAALSGVAVLHLPVPALYAVVLFSALLSAFVRPTTSALATELVDEPDELAGANALFSTMEGAGTLLGPAFAALLLALAAPAVALTAIAMLGVLGAVVTMCIRTKAPAPVDGTPHGHHGRDLTVGFEALLGEPRIAAIFGLILAQSAMRGLLNVFVMAAALSLLELGESGPGGLLSLIGLGGLLGSALSFGLAGGRRLALPFAAGVAAWGVAVLGMAAWPTPVVAWLTLAGLGLGNAIEDVAGLTLLHRLVPHLNLGRALGALWGAAGASVAVGSLAAPGLIAVFGLRGAMAVSGATLVLLVIAAWGQVRHADQSADGRGRTPPYVDTGSRSSAYAAA
ncbi:MAG TPA: MFS transporter [Chloroflexota bacterium]|nr:MFS transporter [Chloroflexota bacterium]